MDQAAKRRHEEGDGANQKTNQGKRTKYSNPTPSSSIHPQTSALNFERPTVSSSSSAQSVPVMAGIKKGHVFDLQGEWVVIQVLRRGGATGFLGMPVTTGDTLSEWGLPYGQDPKTMMPVVMRPSAPRKPVQKLIGTVADAKLEQNKASWQKAVEDNSPTGGVILERVSDRFRCGQFAIPMVDIFIAPMLPSMKRYVSRDRSVDAEPSEWEQAALTRLKKASRVGRPLPAVDHFFVRDDRQTKMSLIDYKMSGSVPPFFKLPVWTIRHEDVTDHLAKALSEAIAKFPSDHVPMDLMVWASLVWVYCITDNPPDHTRKEEIDLDQSLTDLKKGAMKTAGYRREDSQSGMAKNEASAVPFVHLIHFLIYFPHFLRFHEVNRLAFYHHPFRWVSRAYRADQVASSKHFGLPRPGPEDDQWLLLESSIKSQLKSLAPEPLSVITPPDMLGSGLPQWPKKSPGNTGHFMGATADNWDKTKLPDIRTIGLPHYNQTPFPSEGGTPFTYIALPSPWVSRSFPGYRQRIEKPPRVPITEAGPWESTDPLPIVTTPFPRKDIVASRRTGLLFEAKISDEHWEQLKKGQLDGFQEYERVAPSEQIHQYVDDRKMVAIISAKKLKPNTKAQKRKANTRSMEELQRESKKGEASSRDQEGVDKIVQKPKAPATRPEASDVEAGEASEAAQASHMRGPEILPHMRRDSRSRSPPTSPPLPAMFPGMSSKEPGEILAGFQMTYMHHYLGKTLRAAKKRGLMDKEWVLDRRLVLTHPSMPPFEDMDNFGDEWASPPGADPNAEAKESRPPEDHEVQAWVDDLRKLRENKKRSVHPDLSKFEAWLNVLMNGNSPASWEAGASCLSLCLASFVEAEYFQIALELYFKNHTIPPNQLTAQDHVLFHLLYWAHFTGDKEAVSSMDADQLEEFLQGIDIRIPQILDNLEDCATEYKKRQRLRDDAVCPAKEARKRNTTWKLLSEFYEDWGSPMKMPSFMATIAEDRMFLREKYRGLEERLEMDKEPNLWKEEMLSWARKKVHSIEGLLQEDQGSTSEGDLNEGARAAEGLTQNNPVEADGAHANAF